MELMSIMRRVELFRGLTEAQLTRLGAISQREQYPRGAVVFEQNSTGDRMYIVGSGQVEVRVNGSNGTAQTAVYLGEGQVFGEMALVDSGLRSATLVAVGDDTVVYSIPADEFHALCTADTAIGYIMMRNIAQDLSFKVRHRDKELSGS